MFKLISKVFKDVFTDPGNKTYSFVLILGAVGFVWLMHMESKEFDITHQFDFLRCAEGLAFYLGAVGGVHTIQYGIKKMNITTNNNHDKDSL